MLLVIFVDGVLEFLVDSFFIRVVFSFDASSVVSKSLTSLAMAVVSKREGAILEKISNRFMSADLAVFLMVVTVLTM